MPVLARVTCKRIYTHISSLWCLFMWTVHTCTPVYLCLPLLLLLPSISYAIQCCRRTSPMCLSAYTKICFRNSISTNKIKRFVMPNMIDLCNEHVCQNLFPVRAYTQYFSPLCQTIQDSAKKRYIHTHTHTPFNCNCFLRLIDRISHCILMTRASCFVRLTFPLNSLNQILV